MGWPFSKGESGFSASSTAEEVLRGIDGTGLTAVITGASSGIGFETARALAKCGVHVVMAVRNTELGKAAQAAILEENPSGRVEVMELDLSSLDSVRNFATDYTYRGLPLNILINNAGIMATPFALSVDNIEMQMATNHIGHFLLTNCLLDTMKETAIRSNREGRIVIVSSEAHRHSYSQGIAFDHINDPSRYNRFLAYGQSKLANVLHAIELTRRLKEEGAWITANSLHPGQVNTNLMNHIPIISCLASTVGKIFSKTMEQGAATTCYVALHPTVEGVSGQYFKDCNLAKASFNGYERLLWAFSSDKCGYYR